MNEAPVKNGSTDDYPVADGTVLDGIPAAGPTVARLGLAIAKKRAKRAVDRNRIKRIARESFRMRRPTLAGRQIVVMNRDAAAHATSSELRTALDLLWNKIERVPLSGRSVAASPVARQSDRQPEDA